MEKFDPLDFDLFDLESLDNNEKVINEPKNQIKNPLNALPNLGGKLINLIEN